MKTLSLFLSLTVVMSASPLDPEQLAAEIPASHPELQFYREELAAARARAKAAATRPAPELAVELGRKRVEGAGNFAAEGTAWSVSLAQTFEWPGRLALRKSLANSDVALAELGVARSKPLSAPAPARSPTVSPARRRRRKPCVKSPTATPP